MLLINDLIQRIFLVREMDKKLNKQADEFIKILHTRFEFIQDCAFLSNQSIIIGHYCSEEEYNNYCSNHHSFWSCETCYELS